MSMLTTEDNPFSPYKQWDEWYMWDTTHGYNTCAYLARICATSPYLTDIDEDEAITQAQNEIMKYNLTGNYKLVDE